MIVQQAWRWRRLLPFAVPAAMVGCLASLLMPVIIILGAAWAASSVVSGIAGGIAHVATCIFAGCPSAPGPTTSVWTQSRVKAVTVTWLPFEEQAVNYYCQRQTPCVDVAFVQAIMMQESGGDPTATSGGGAMGLMQVEPSHFSPGQNPYDPLTNLMVGVGFLDSLDAMFSGNLPLVAAGYNAGPGAPRQWEALYGTSDWSVLSQEPVVESWGANQGITTAQYVNDVMSYYTQFTALGQGASPHGLH